MTILTKTLLLVPTYGMFDAFSAHLDKTARRYLRGLKQMLATAKKVRCEGYTSKSRTRSKAELKRIGMRRARAVCSYLRKIGVDAQLSRRSYGSKRPLAPRKNWRATKSSQRVELRLTR